MLKMQMEAGVYLLVLKSRRLLLEKLRYGESLFKFTNGSHARNLSIQTAQLQF